MQTALNFLQETFKRRAKRCERGDCRRYFIADKPRIKFHDQKCANIVTRENKREWAEESRKKGRI